MQRPYGRCAGGDSWNKFEESGPEWRSSKKPLIEEYTFAYPRCCPVSQDPVFIQALRTVRTSAESESAPMWAIELNIL